MKSSKVLRDRIASFQVQKPFQCLSCDVRFKLKDSLKRHQKSKHADQTINQAAEKNTNEKSNPVNAHVGSPKELSMTNNMPNGINASLLYGNIKLPNIVLKPTNEKERKWNCPTCNTDFQSRRILRNHIAFVHRGQKPIT